MKKIICFMAVNVILITLFTACPPVNNNEISPVTKFIGKWKSESLPPYDDWFEVSSDKVNFTYYNNSDPTNDIAYKANIICTDISGDITFLNLKITDNGSWDLTVDWYTRVFLKKKTDIKYEMSTGWLNGSVKETLLQAKTNFTVENGAFGYTPEYTKQ